MAIGSNLLLLCCFQVLIFTSVVRSEQVDTNSPVAFETLTSGADGYVLQKKCENCGDGEGLDHRRSLTLSSAPRKDIDITAIYTDATGDVKTLTVNTRDLSSSWVIEKYDDDENYEVIRGKMGRQGLPKRPISESQDYHHSSTEKQYNSSAIDPLKLDRRKLREERKQSRAEKLVHSDPVEDLEMQLEAIKRSKSFDITDGGKYKIWKREFRNQKTDSFLKYMKDQIILAKVYSSIARSNKETRHLSDELNRYIKENINFIGEAYSDGDLPDGAESKANAIGNVLAKAKVMLYDCGLITRKLRALVQTIEENVVAQRKKALFLMEFVSFSIPKSLHCLALQLTNDYFLQHHPSDNFPNLDKIEDPSLYHYAIFSDNVLSAWVVVNSTVMNAKEPQKHVFHVITDGRQFPAMKMWFIAHPPLPATVHVGSFDEFKWLNSSYCPVLQQLESAKMKEFYFKANNPSKLSDLEQRLKFKNPKYLSLLNHIRFYIPELFPKLDKILFLDDDVVVQKDLTPLWSIDLKGMVNGAVETCRKDFHEFKSYLNFSNPDISQNFDPHACGWAFGMNIFDLKLWRKLNLTAVYHHWQGLNKDRQLWSLGTLPPGLLTFYNLTYPLDKSWHLLALGYLPSIKSSDIEKSAVIHFNGNNKPWLDLAYARFKGYWSRYISKDDPYIQSCNVNL